MKARSQSRAERQRIFEGWMREHQGLLFKVIRAYAFTPTDREDLFQEITAQVWRSLPGYRGEAAVTTWLYRVALYCAMSWSKKERSHRARQADLSANPHLLRESEAHPDPRLAWLYEQIAQLEEIDRSLVLLHLDGFSYREIAGTLGLSESNVGVKLNRIKKSLTAELQATTTDEL